MHNGRKLRVWLLGLAMTGVATLPGCLGAFQQAVDTVLSPAAAGNLLHAPYSMFSHLTEFFARIR